MPRARVFVKATFVSTKAGKAPSVFIKRPDNISDLIGDIDIKGYNLLQSRIADIVHNVENDFWFQKDKQYDYRFD